LNFIKKSESKELLNMKRNKIKLSEREVKFTYRCHLECQTYVVGKGKTNGLCEKEIIVVILSMK